MKKVHDGKIRVLIGANDLLLAGVQRLVVDQIQLLDRSRFEVHLIVLMQFEGKETFNDLIPKDVTVHQLSFSGLADLGQWMRVFSLLSEIRPDVVKTATFFSNSVFLALKPFFGYAVVAAEHNTVSVKPRWQRIVDRILLPRAYTVVGDSQMVVDFVSKTEHIDPRHFTVVYNGVDLVAIARAEKEYLPHRVEIRAEYGIPPQAYVIFTAARMVKQKNHALMIEGFAQLCKQRNDVYLVIAGDGGLRPDLEALIRERGIGNRVVLLGERKDVHRFYSISDIFLLTSIHEGFCIAAMEGLAFGLPLISTRVAGVSEYLQDGENGFFVDAEPSDIAEKLLAVIQMGTDTRARFAQIGKETAKEYSTERYGQAIGALLERASG